MAFARMNNWSFWLLPVAGSLLVASFFVPGGAAAGSLIVLISDLFDDIDAFERFAAQFYHRRHDLIVMQTLDPAELTFPFRSASDFVGLEGEGRLALDPNALRNAYLEALQKHTDRVEDITRRFHFDYVRVNTGETLLAPLSQFLARRAAQINRGSK